MKFRCVLQSAASLALRIQPRSRIAALATLASLTIGLATAIPARAQADYSSLLYNFTGATGQNPHNGALLKDASGNLFGTTEFGGTYGFGAVFELVNSSGTYTQKVLYNFAGGYTTPTDGIQPTAGLIMDASGNLYGTASQGGTNEAGIVFELVNSSGSYTENVLYRFKNGPDGALPFGGVIMDSSGNLYGTTALGGHGNGNVFELVNSSGTYTEKILYSFVSNPDGANPYAGLTMDSSGNLYGATNQGGTNGAGAVFELANSSGTYTEKVLYSFANSPDSAYPDASLIMDSSGNLYGTSIAGGPNNAGTVFELVNSSGAFTEKVLYSFMNIPDGAQPYGSLLIDSNGNLYGTTYYGGTYSSPTTLSGFGTAFELVNSSGTYSEKILYEFGGPCATSGTNPYSALIIDTSGNLFGATALGGNGNYGTVFELTPFPGTAQPTTTTLISLAGNPVAAGSGFSFTATVTSSLIIPPTGSVTFFDNGNQLGTAQLFCGTTGLSTDPLENIPIGTNTFTAQYNPDNTALFQPSSTSLMLTVNQAASQVIYGNNTYNGNETINGSLVATSISGNGNGLTSLNPANLTAGTAGINISGTAATATNAVALGGIAPSGYATIGANSFTGAQTMPSATVSGQVKSGSIAIGGGTAITEYVSVTLSVALPALNANSCTTFTTAALTGFTPGTSDTIAFGIPSSLQSGLTAGVYLIWQAWETTTTLSPTITVQACNGSPTKLNAGSSGVIRLDVFKH